MKSSEMKTSPISEAPAKPTTPPPVPLAKIYPVGTHVLATLKDGSRVNAVVKGFDEPTDRFKVVWEKSPRVPAIAYVSLSNIKKLKTIAETVEFSRHKIGEVIVPTETDNVIADMMDRFYEEEGKIAATEILDGHEEGTLKEHIKSYVTKSGHRVVAATDKGIGYKDWDEDRVVVSPRADMMAVVDGMGGQGNGKKAAEILAAELAKNPVDIALAVENAKMKMDQDKMGISGACFMASRVRNENGRKMLDYYQAGDVKLIVIGKNGKLKHESTDQNFADVLLKYKIITPDQANYSLHRNAVINGVTTAEYLKYIWDIIDQEGGKLDVPNKEAMLKEIRETMGQTYSNTVPVESGDLVLIISDGISGNFDTEEICQKVANETPEEAVEILSDETDVRMMDADNIFKTTKEQGGRENLSDYSDGYRQPPTRDNRGITAMLIA